MSLHRRKSFPSLNGENVYYLPVQLTVLIQLKVSRKLRKTLKEIHPATDSKIGKENIRNI